MAPISGGNRSKRFKKETELEEEAPVLDSIRFRYSEEVIAEETAVTAEPEQPAEAAPSKNRNRNRRRRGRSGEKPQAEKTDAPKAEKAPKPQAEKPQPAQKAEGEGAKKPRRRPNHRRHKPKSGGEAPQA